ncbi:MAG: M20 family peptidase [Christensenellales bacterium]|jgi:carboxypeptidase PM20D1
MVIAGMVLLFLLIVLARGAAFKQKDEKVESSNRPKIDEKRVADSLAEMVKCRTISSYDAARMDDAEFEKFRTLLRERYPLVHEKAEVNRIARNGLLYRWPGKQRGNETVLMAHYDVVPVNEGDWERPPFAGIVEDGVLWGRGTIDTKVTLCGVMEAAESLMAQGFVPEHDIYFSFAGDEETSSLDAPAIVEELKNRGVKPALVVDEGGAVVEGVFPGVEQPCALIGAGEKGLCNIQLTAKSSGGHASTPPRSTPLGKVARAVAAIENNPMPASFPRPTKEMFDILGRRAPFGYRVLFGNMWLFSGLLKRVFTKSGGELNAMCRTTVAFTMASASSAPNVLPAEASVVANCRISGRDSVASLVEHFKTYCGKDVEVTVLQSSEPTPYADTKGPEWAKVKRAIHEVYPDAIVAPYVMLAASDSRHFCKICDNLLRFSPLRLTKEERGLIHAANERIPLEKAADCARFYVALIQQL